MFSMKQTVNVAVVSIVALCAGAGCAVPAGEEVGEQSSALEGCRTCSVPTLSAIQELGDDRYRVEQQAALDAPLGAAWAKLGDLEKFFAIALPNAVDPHWVIGNGKSPGDEFNFLLEGALIRLQVVTRDKANHVFEYKLLQPALGIEELASTLRLERCGHQTKLIWTREFRMTEGTSFDALSEVVVQEFNSIIAYFE